MNNEQIRATRRAEVQAQREVAAGIIRGFMGQTDNKRVLRALARAAYVVAIHIPEKRGPRQITAAADQRKAEKRGDKNAALKRRAGNHHQRWTQSHDDLVLKAAFRDEEIGKITGRTLLAVRNRRVILKKQGRLA